MNLAQHYAAASKDVDTKALIAYMKKRGHLSLLPRVVRILEREQPKQDVVTVAHAEDSAKLTKEYPTARVVVDPRIVGGYSVLAGTKLVDRTYRTALVNLYQKITS